MIKKNFIKGLLLALELESANAILKMGIFTSLITQSSSFSLLSSSSVSNFNNFIFFVAVLSLRIAINQTLRRFSMTQKQSCRCIFFVERMSYNMDDRQMQATMCLLLIYSINYDYMHYDNRHFAIKKNVAYIFNFFFKYITLQKGSQALIYSNPIINVFFS